MFNLRVIVVVIIIAIIIIIIIIIIMIMIIVIVMHCIRGADESGLGAFQPPGSMDNEYTQFAIQDSCLFGPNPWKILAPPSNYLSNNDFWATQPLEQILDSEFLLCELGVPRRRTRLTPLVPELTPI